jgi:ferritin-like metal-binding protein YciE
VEADLTGAAGAEKLIRQLADVHAIEEQALAQMREAAETAGDERLTAIFAEHLTRTEGHERQVRGRLAVHGVEPLTLKELAAEAGGLGLSFFAAHRPDSPGKLTAHAYS